MERKPFAELVNTEVPTLVDFHAEWCGPCKMMKPILEQVKEQMGERVRIIKIDVDKNPGIAQRYQVQGVPTLILFRHGQVTWRQSGVVPVEGLKDAISRAGGER